MSEAITKADDLFRQLNENLNETRRWLVGKYSPKGNYNINFDKATPKYDGPPICTREFDFTPKGPRCHWCNSLCLLTKDGHFVDKEIIQIKSGSYRGQEIQVFKFPLLKDSSFGSYNTIQPQTKSDMNNIRNICKRQWLQNQSDNVSHDIAISCLLNSANYPFRSTTLGVWMCEDINLIKFVPTLGSFKTAIFTPDLFKNTFFQIYMMSMIGSFSHGNPNANCFYVSNMPSSFDVPGKKIQMGSTVFMDMCEYSSYSMDYDGRFLYFTGKAHDFTVEEPEWKLEFSMTNDKLVPRQHTKSPCKPSYLTCRMTTFVPSISIMNYIRSTGVNVFPHMYYIIYMTILLMNQSFFEVYNKSSAKTIFSKIFIDSEYEKYIDMISKHFGETPSCDDIITMLSEANIHIRDDTLEFIKSDMVTFITAP